MAVRSLGGEAASPVDGGGGGSAHLIVAST